MLQDTSSADATAASPTRQRRLPWANILLIMGTVVLTIVLVQIPPSAVERLGSYGYLGVFGLTLVSSASIVLPSPALAAALLAGRTLNPWLVGLVGGVAAGLGEITGYTAGRGGSPLVMRSRFYPPVEGWVRRWGVLTIFGLSALPGPLLDLAGIAAGTMRMPFWRFLLPCLLGKIIRFVLVAWIGRLAL